jgi:hypothetical protein
VLDTTTGAWKGYKLNFNKPAPRPVPAEEEEETVTAAAAEVGDEGAAGLGLNAAAGDKGACPIAVE